MGKPVGWVGEQGRTGWLTGWLTDGVTDEEACEDSRKGTTERQLMRVTAPSHAPARPRRRITPSWPSPI